MNYYFNLKDKQTLYGGAQLNTLIDFRFYPPSQRSHEYEISVEVANATRVGLLILD